MILYLANSSYVNLLDDLEMPIKKLTGHFSLLSFVVKDMRHFSHVNFIVIDRKAVMESDEEMVQALLSLQTMYEIRVVIIAEGLLNNSPFLQQLIQAGITNIVSAVSIKLMKEEINDCFSYTGMQRFISPAPYVETSYTSDTIKIIKEKYHFDCQNIRIAIAGSDRRVGVTTTAINLAYWINEHGGAACYLEANKSKHLAHIIHTFKPQIEGNAHIIESLDFYLTSDLNRNYNFIIMDCGVLEDPKPQEEFYKSEIRVLCGSAMPYELPTFYRAMERCREFPLFVLGLFVPNNLQYFMNQILKTDIFLGESSHDLFNSEANKHFYRQVLKEYLC